MSLVRRVLNLFSHSKVDREIEAQLKPHIEMRTEDNVPSGMSPDVVGRDALFRFGNPTLPKQQVIAVDAAFRRLWGALLLPFPSSSYLAWVGSAEQ